MAIKHILEKQILITIMSLVLVQCQSVTGDTISPTNEMPYKLSETSSVTPAIAVTQSTNTSTVVAVESCTLPPIQISSLNIRQYYWSEDSRSIFFREKNEQVWYSYDVFLDQITTTTTALSITSTPEYTGFDLSNYQDVFLSPSGELVLFTRAFGDDLKIYYKTLDESTEHYLGIVHGVIEKVAWFNDEESAIIAMAYAGLPSGVSAYVYVADFSENTLMVEMPLLGPYRNAHYLGLTPDGTSFMFVTYDGNPVVRIWNIATDEVSRTPMFNPMSFRWLGENEIVSVNPNRDKLFFVDILLYNIDTLEVNYLAKGEFALDPHIENGLISPDGTAVAYIENETGNLYWTRCID